METISASVGKDGRNLFKDVSVIQTLLNACSHLLSKPPKLQVDGKIGPKTITTIEAFQSTVVKLSSPDGRIDPGGKTLAKLNAAAAAQPTQTNSNGTTAPLKVGARNLKFPLSNRPVQSYKSGMRRFGSARSKGRLHAGCDLYAPVGTPIYAMDDGVIERAGYAFYLGTYAIEIRHPQFLARYGELGNVSKSLTKGAKIKKGQQIGTVGQLRGLNMSMLHLELYSGKGSGPLTKRQNMPYKRRSDLIDPTPILDKAK